MNRKRHICKAEHNELFFRSFDIDKTNYRDWVVTGIFYTLIHCYEAYFSLFNKHSGSHDISDDWISNDPNISDTYDDYRELKQERWQASYRSTPFSATDIRDSLLPKFDRAKAKILAAK
jgi:hypothetical protein